MTFFGLLVLVSCDSEDPELVARREHQKLEIKRLEAELVIAQRKIGEPLPDRSHEVKKAKQQLEEAKGEIIGVEEEVAALKEEKRVIEKQFEEYRRRYPLPEDAE